MLSYEFKISGASCHICCSVLFTPALLYMFWTILSSVKRIKLRSQSICVYHIDGILYSQPYGYIGKHFCNTSPISKRSFLKYRKIRHHSIMNNIFHNLIYKIYLTTVKICFIQKFCESSFRNSHIKSHNFPYKHT